MNWADATLNFSNCLGPILQLKLDELYDDDNYPETEAAFTGLVNLFIWNLCLDEDAKGTLKQGIERGNWIKPKDVEIQDHHTKVIHLFNWIDQVPGFHRGVMSEAEKHRLYVATFPTQWAKQFQSQRGFTEATTYESIDEFIQTQKDNADRSKKKRKKEEENNNRRNNQRRNGNQNTGGKIQINQKARSGPTSKCKKHPNSNNAWGDCHLNPSNPNNKLGNQNSDQNSNRNGSYNQNNQRYDKRNQYQNNDNNCQQPRQSYYKDNRRLPPPPPPRDNYSNQGPPSHVSVGSGQSYFNSDDPRGQYVWIPC